MKSKENQPPFKSEGNIIKNEKTVAANNLSPQKAVVLLRLALLDSPDHDALIRIFSEY